MILILIISFISLIGLLILHEFSHFIMAKKFGIEVQEFGIGYPPRIISKKFKGTIYSLNLLPFGAFVRISENDLKQKPISQRAIVIIAGVVSFWIISAILITIILIMTQHGFFEAITQGVRITFEWTGKILMAFGQMIQRAILRQPLGGELMGPIGIFGIFVEAGTLGAVYFLQTLVLICLNMAVLNILPIPVTDGGRLLFLGIEKIRKKPLSEKTEQKINVFFFFALIALMLLVTIKDIRRVL